MRDINLVTSTNYQESMTSPLDWNIGLIELNVKPNFSLTWMLQKQREIEVITELLQQIKL
jgi:hypothetical protein